MALFSEARNAWCTDEFPVPEGLSARVDFWKKIYSEVTSDEGFLHDTQYVHLIYKKLSFTDLAPLKKRGGYAKAVTDRVTAERLKITLLLKEISHALEKRLPMGAEAHAFWDKILAQLSAEDLSKIKFQNLTLHKRIRFQGGLRDHFLEALKTSGKYIGEMEKIFKAEGVPEDLTRIPFVESSFQNSARSKVGAVGLWQFMPATGKLYLRIDEVLDERRDPYVATRAAARLLKANYELLNSWPLAVTAYNHGGLGMKRAVKKVRSKEIAEIIRHYESPTFGFASANFYAEFLAALYVERNSESIFGSRYQLPPLKEGIDFKIMKTAKNVPVFLKDFLKNLSAIVGLADREFHKRLIELNPALSDSALNNKTHLPKDFPLRLPASEKNK